MEIAGLILNILGTIVLFFFGFPQPNHDEDVSLGISEDTIFADGTSVKSIKAATKRKKLLYKGMSSLGMALLLFGFTLQLISLL